jgi:Ca2+-binding RTX toxin-like protein
MSFHFLNGNTYGAYADTGPGSIIVDPLATIQSTNVAALTLQSGPWTIDLNGKVQATGAAGIYLSSSDTLSTLRLGAGASVTSDDTTAVLLNDAANVTNGGTIGGGDNGLEIGGISDHDYSIKNLKTGKIIGVDSALAIYGSGTHTIANAGLIQYDYVGSGYAITGNEGTEKLTNWGVVNGLVDLGGGNDVFTNFKKVGHVVKNGVANDVIDLGAGDDRFNGGNRAEIVKDGDGKDVYKFGGGNDRFIGLLDENTVDVVDGGKGRDFYDAVQSGVSGVVINLDKVAHRDPYVDRSVAANIIDDVNNAATPGDKIFNFESAFASAGNDSMFGTKGAQTLVAGAGDDNLFGLGGNDELNGQSGNDHLIGGAGRDELSGGGNVDTFVFSALKDSGPTKASRDTIHDFELGVDHIDLTTLNLKLGNIITDFLGVDVAFTGHKGDLRAVTVGDDTVVQLDVNGDRHSDFSVQLDGHHALTDGDFILFAKM